MRLEMLKATVDKSRFCFWLISCGRIKNKEKFKKQHDVNQLGNDEITLKSVAEKEHMEHHVFDDSEAESDTKGKGHDDDVVAPEQVELDVPQDSPVKTPNMLSGMSQGSYSEAEEMDNTMNYMLRTFMSDGTQMDFKKNNTIKSEF